MTQSPTNPLPFPASWKLQQASVHPQGCLHWEIASKSSSAMSEWTDAFLLFPPFPYQISGSLSWPLLSSSAWDPANATTTDLASSGRGICSRKGSILLFRTASCWGSSSKCCPLPPPVLVHCAHQTSAGLIRPFPWMVLIWFGSRRKGTWQNSYGVLFSLSQLGLLISCSLSLSHSCAGKPRPLCPGFYLSSQSLIPEVSNSPIRYKYSF